MTWLSFALAVGAAIAVLGVVGGALSWSLGLRGLWAVAAAPAFALTSIALASIVAPVVGLSWSLLPVLFVTVVLGLSLFLVRRRWVGSLVRQKWTRPDRWVIGALVVCAVFLAWRVCVAIGEPTNFSQTFDAIFHLNGVRFVLDTGNASSLHIGRMTSPAGTLPFYPAAWHAFVSLIIEITGVAIPIGVNAVTLVISAVIWPLGAVLLTRTLFGNGWIVSVAAVVASAGLPAFPFLLMDYGVLFPFQLGLSLVPVALAAALNALGLAAERTAPQLWWAVIFAGTVPGIALAHPGAFVAVLALSFPMVVTFAGRLFARAAVWGRVWVVAGFVAYVFVGLQLLRILRPPLEARQWPPTMSIAGALEQVVTGAMWYALPSLVVAIAVLVGVVAAFVTRERNALVAVAIYAVAALLFVAVSAFTQPQLRDLLSGSWYNNIPRLAAIVPLTMVPLAAFGVGWTARLVTRRAAAASVSARRVAVLIGAVTATLATLLVLTGPVLTVTSNIAASYRITPDSPLISSDEYTLLQRLDQHVPSDAVVAGNPWTGAALAYALAGRRVLLPHTLSEISRDIQAIDDGLANGAPGSAVCDAVARTGTHFVLDFGEREIFPGTHHYPGLEHLDSSAAVRLVDEQGEARLYEVVACGASGNG